ncbi:restriction endonuclease [Nocardia crassostreae]|uniref:restriction endonuclease n=1 Tax=Nocardia crassostreae TaxID=53428 RepID=UPI0008340AB3|nr:restriction endonuclease [Nocardia crassostreae]
MPDGNYAIPFDQLSASDLRVEHVYLGGNQGSTADDPLARLLQVGNQGGFRYKGSVKEATVRLVVLYTSGTVPDWPDNLDVQTGIFTYYGDNREPGRSLHETARSGNRLLSDVFQAAHGSSAERAKVPPFLLFEKAAPGRAVRFRGLLAPGASNLPADEDLTAIWRSKSGERFQNYRAVFTVLDADAVPRVWLNAVQSGQSALAALECPKVWREWVEGRAYHALVAPSTLTVREKDQQLPADPGGVKILQAIRRHFEGRETDFEHCAVAIWRMFAPSTGQCEVTPPSGDGGRDAIGEYLLGPAGDRLGIAFSLEAKCYSQEHGVGVREMSRLISRLRHRQFGVFVTLSYFNKQVYQEVRTDAHPIVMVCGRDVVDVLRQRGYGDVPTVQSWLDNQFPELGSQ